MSQENVEERPLKPRGCARAVLTVFRVPECCLYPPAAKYKGLNAPWFMRLSGCERGSGVPTLNSPALRAIRVKETPMRKPSSIRIGLARSLPIAAVLVVTTGSSTAMALQSARESTTVAPGSFGTAVAKCRGDRTAVSGGFAAPGFDPNAGATVGRLGSKRVSKRGIETRAFNFGNQAGALISFAYCAQHSHGLRVRSTTTQVDPNSRGSTIAKCPRHTIAVGGGFGTYRFSVDQGPQVITSTSKRLGERRWKVVGFNPSMRSGTLVAHAYCEAAPFQLVTRSKEV